MFVQDKHLIAHLDSVTGSLRNVSKLFGELDRKLEENFADDLENTPVDGSLVSILGALERSNAALVAIFQQTHGTYFPKSRGPR